MGSAMPEFYGIRYTLDSRSNVRDGFLQKFAYYKSSKWSRLTVASNAALILDEGIDRAKTGLLFQEYLFFYSRHNGDRNWRMISGESRREASVLIYGRARTRCDISNFALSVDHCGISCVMSAIKHAAHTCEQKAVSGRFVRLNFEVES